jgi:hypothetical protein
MKRSFCAWLILLATTLAAISATALSCGQEQPADEAALRKAATFYASFDEGVRGDFGQGGLEPGTRFNDEKEKGQFVFEKGVDAKIFRIAKGKGVQGGALEATDVLPRNGRVYFPVKGNLAYKKGGWDGAMSVWCKTDPNQLLKTKFCDPIQITQKGANNGGIWFDFNDAQPRDLRHGAFPAVAEGAKAITEDDPQAPMVRVPKINWKAESWHHVVLSWKNFDTGKEDAVSALFIDGNLIGEVKGRAIAMNWDVEKAGVYIAVSYIGLLDELALFSRALSAAEVRLLHTQPGLLAPLKKEAPRGKGTDSQLPDVFPGETKRLRGEVLDAGTGKPLPARVYVQGADGSWHFARSDAKDGSAVEYRKQRDPKSVEMHTTLSAHPFLLDLPPGQYTLTVERGKEYLPESRTVTIGREPVAETFRLRRWIDMSSLGWYSGETHVHRSLEELPNVMLAEDLNVALPLLYWVTEAFAAPRTGGRSTTRDIEAKPIAVDATHVIYPRNTEYEIFTVDKKPHTLGAVFVLNHKSVFEEGVPPVGPVAARAKKEGALLELDKHNWPWSMMLVPVMGIDLYELSNNHVWRTEFGFPGFGEPAASWMQVERGPQGFTETGWVEYGLQNYYTLLDCGFWLRPTAGTASGVHPVPLGFGRVYVHVGKDFSYDAWVKGLNEGRSFVTTGPLLLAELDGRDPGAVFRPAGDGLHTFRLTGQALSPVPLSRIEVVINGEVAERLKPANRQTDAGGYESLLDAQLKVDGSSWLAVRCYEDRPNGRVRFAHTAPWHVEVEGKPLRPRKAEVEYLVKRVEEQLKRSAGVLPEAALAEYREGLQAYKELVKTAR